MRGVGSQYPNRLLHARRERSSPRRGGLVSCAAPATDMSREERKTTTKLTLEDLEAMRRHYGIAQEEEEDLLEDLGQVEVLGEVGIGLERWASLRGVPMEYALALGEYLDQEEEEEANGEGPEH
jgi:hypothetical protein